MRWFLLCPSVYVLYNTPDAIMDFLFVYFFAYNGGVIRVAYGSRRRVSLGVLFRVSVVY